MYKSCKFLRKVLLENLIFLQNPNHKLSLKNDVFWNPAELL
jgi:hypothetical protein